MSMFKILIFSAFLFTSLSASASQQFVPYGEGMPAPWPFPWAKECPVKWSSLSGRYVMYDEFERGEVDLKLSILNRNGLRMMRISRFSSDGKILSDGFSVMTNSQKSVRVYLRPMSSRTPPVWASLKLHFDKDFSCEMSRLVPILTLHERRANSSSEAQYRLVRRPIYE